MRITDSRRETIIQEVASILGSGASVWSFGSRASDTARGGNIDLYVEVIRPVPPRLKARLVVRLEQQLANHVDLIIREPGSADAPIFRIARQTGVRLDGINTRAYTKEHPLPS